MTAPTAAAGQASSIVHLDRLELAFAPQPWRFADERRADIDKHFAQLKAAKPALWNGRMLMLAEHTLARSVFRGSLLETDFASFIAWRDWGFPEAGVHNCFAMGALRARDGAYLLGVMGPDTVNAGKVYFPAGVPDLDDIVDGKVDLARNVAREVAEETGLQPGDYMADAGWVCVRTGRRLAMMKLLAAPETAEELRTRILAHLARDAEPELADIRIVRGPADLDALMPPFVTAYLQHIWSHAP
jgi:8-oxo-dGTP pyrophosphatase MutT (NUDIX family)